MLTRLRPREGWRHFLGEVGVIVLGVLIALGFGQLAQEWNDERNLRSAEAAIRRELAGNLGLLGNRQRVQPCIDRRLDEIARLLDDAEAGRMTTPLWIGRPQIWTIATGNYQAATQSGRASLFPVERQSLYAAVYASFAEIGVEQGEEQMRWARLRTLEGRRTLDPVAINLLREALSEARLLNWSIKLAIDQNARSLEPLKIMPTKPRSPGSRSVCLPLSTPRAEALRLAGSRLEP